MAIGIVATNKMAAYLASHGSEALAEACKQLSGFQLFLTTVMVGYVLINFTRMLQKKEMRG
jgi:exfoliative toxin A/B